ncbi:MAG: ATP-binding protein [Fusobacteriaceae bacterium]|nr:ATP-binding protein [Fusobacteriaceae bacterium]
MYFKRHAEDSVRKLAKMFGAILVTGPRQVGKTTLLEQIATDMAHVTLDDPLLLMNAREHGRTFFQDYPPPVFVDEIQYAPELFPIMKMSLDKTRKKGQFYLTGSQQFDLMKNVSESLAGRIGILTLSSFSLREIYGLGFAEPFIPTNTYFQGRLKEAKAIPYQDVWNRIHRGSMPELVLNPDFDWEMFYGAYVKTYIERDVRKLTQVGDELKFITFMTIVAGRTGQLLNLESIARDVGVSQPTAQRWLSILVASNLVYLLKSYHNNLTKRAVKIPKLYFLDTGLAAWLTRWTTPDVLKNGAMAGAFFESFVVAEILKSYYNTGVLEPPLYYYRDKDAKEIDLLILENGVLHPLEIKKHADPTKRDIATFSILDNIPDVKRGTGGVICLYDNLVSLTETDKVIPVHYL